MLFSLYEIFPDVTSLMSLLTKALLPNSSALYGEFVELRVSIMKSEIYGTRLFSSFFV